MSIYLNVENYESLTVRNYMESETLSGELRYAASRLEYLLRAYKSEEFIKKGGTVKDIDINDSWQLTNLYNNYIAENNYEDNISSRDLFWKEKGREIEDIKNIRIR